MHTLFVTHSAALSGAELAMVRLLSGLGPNCSALVLEEGPLIAELRRQKVSTECRSFHSLSAFRRRLSAAGAVRGISTLAEAIAEVARARRRHELTVAFSQKAFVLSALAQPLVKRPLIWALNDILMEEHFSSMMIRLVVYLANTYARTVVVNSNASADAFVSHGGDRKRVDVIYPGIDLSAFDLTPPLQSELSGRRLRVACVGRLSPWKGQHVLVRALAEVPEAEAWVIGAPLFGEEGYERELKQLAEKLRLANRISFLGYRPDVSELIGACDVLVHTSTAPEPFGQVIVEGLAAGRAVIATAAGGAPEILRDGIDGLLVKPGDPSALALALRRLYFDHEMRLVLGRHGRERARIFQTDTMVDQFRSVLASFRLAA